MNFDFIAQTMNRRHQLAISSRRLNPKCKMLHLFWFCYDASNVSSVRVLGLAVVLMTMNPTARAFVGII